jgi:hypothetical protein
MMEGQPAEALAKPVAHNLGRFRQCHPALANVDNFQLSPYPPSPSVGYKTKSTHDKNN